MPLDLARLLRVTVLLIGTCLVALPVFGDVVPPSTLVDRVDEVPKPLRSVDVKEHLGRMLPKHLAFRDQDGKQLTFGEVFDGEHPVLLTLNYSNCPMLCSLQLNGLVDGLKQVEWGINRDYKVVTVSLQPDEPVDIATRTRNRYLTQYGRPDAQAGWRFLAGSEQNVKAFADAIGFSFHYDTERDEYAHPAAIVLASPHGKIARYLYGLEYDPKTLRLGLVEASEGRVGTTLDRLILYCYHYDSSVGRYAPVARRIMQLGGAVTVVLLGLFLTVLFRADARRKRHFAESTAT
jgi:protein SCO1/2